MLFTGGVNVATGDVDGDGREDVLTSPRSQGGPVYVFNAEAQLLANVQPFGNDVQGVHIGAADLNADGKADIVTGAGSGAPHVRVFSGANQEELHTFFAFDSAFAGGVFVAAAQTSGGEGSVEFTSPNTATFRVGDSDSFAVTTTGGAGTAISANESLPGGLTLTSHGDGTATIAGTPSIGTGAQYTFDLIASQGGSEAGTQSFTLTVHEPPTILAESSDTWLEDESRQVQVETTGYPVPSLSSNGSLPNGVTFTDRGDGTAELAGPALEGGSFPLVFVADNGIGSPAEHDFQLTVVTLEAPPAITSATGTGFTVGVDGTFLVTTTGVPTPTITPSGALPAGVRLTNNGDGTATLAGPPSPGSAGVYPLTFTAANGVGSPAIQSFTLTVNESGTPIISSADAASVAIGAAASFLVTTSGTPPVSSIALGGTLPVGVTFTDQGNGTATLSGTPDPGTEGPYALTFTADNGSGTATQDFTLTVTPVSGGAPTITSANTTTFVVGAAGSFLVTTTATPTPTLGLSGALPSGVTFTDNGDGTATLGGPPDAATAGTYPLAFTATNSGGVDTQDFTLTVANPTAGPIFTSAPSTTFTIGIGGSFTVTTVGTPQAALALTGALPANVLFSDNGDGTATISGTPQAGTGGLYSVTLTANNGVGGDVDQAFTLSVQQVAAITSPNATSFPLNAPGTFTVTTAGVPTPALTRTGTLPAGVSFTDNGDGTGTLSGTATETGTFNTIQFTATNGVGAADIQDFTLAVSVGVNPTAVDDNALVLEDAAAAVPVLANDTDSDGGPIAIQAVTQPANGVVVITGGGTGLTYQPNANYCNDPPGTTLDTFTYTLSPGGSTATVSVTVTCADDNPTAADDIATVDEDAAATAIAVLANDADPDGGALLITGASDPANGTVVITGGGTGLTYQPDANYCNNPPGTTLDTFTYTITGGSDATVSVTVTCLNDTPLTQPDTLSDVLEDSGQRSISIATLVGNDAPGPPNESGQSLSVVSVGNPVGGTVTLAPPNVLFDLTPNFNGPASFTYVAEDNGTPALQSVSTTVSFTVTDINDAPSFTKGADQLVDEDAAPVTVNGWATGISAGPSESSQTVTFAITDNTNAALFSAGPSVAANGTLTYSLAANQNGSATITLKITDNGGTANGGVNESATQSFTITVNAVNDAPVAQAQSFNAQANMQIVGLTGFLSGVTDADSGINGCTPTFTLNSVGVTSPVGGSVTITDANAGVVTFDPPPGVAGNVTFTYTVQDNGCPGSMTSAPATATVNVAGPVIWFVNPAVAGPGDGRLSNPFKFLAGNAGVNNDADDVDAADHRIFVHSGTTTASPIALNAGEWIVGQGVTGASFDNVMGITPPTGTIARPSIGGALPTLQGTVTVNTQSATNVVKLLGFNLSTGTAAGLSNAGTTINGVTVNIGSVTTSTGNAIAISGVNNCSSAANAFTFSSVTVTGAATSPLSIANFTGTFTVSGVTNIQQRAGTGILLNNMSGTVSFAATTVLNPTDAGGYGIRVQSSSAAVTFASATISNTNVVSAQSDAGDGIPDTDGDGDAIFLTSNTGSFTLNGGTLSNCGNDCIDLRNASNLVLSNVNISAPGQDVTGATGQGFGGHGIWAFNLTGTSSITGGTISQFNVGDRDGATFTNQVSTPLTLTIQGTTFQNATGNRGLAIAGQATSNMTVTVGGPTNNVATNCIFENISATALQVSAGGSPAGSTATVNFTVQHSTFQTSPVNGKTNRIGSNVEAGKLTLNILNNTFSNVFKTASTGEGLISLSGDGTLAGNTFAATIQGNVISNVGSSVSNCGGGATACLGPVNAILVFIDDATNVPGTLVIDSNTLTNVQQGGIFVDMANTGAPSSPVSAKIINNTVGTDAGRVGIGAGGTIQSGIRVERRRTDSPGGNALISGNSVRNGNGGAGSTLNSPGIWARTNSNSTLSVTVTGNNVDTNQTGVGVGEMRFDTNDNDGGAVLSPTQCVDISGNTFPAGLLALIDINEINGTHNVEQASALAVTVANGTLVVVTADAGVSFGVGCAAPPSLMAAGGRRPAWPVRSAVGEADIAQLAADVVGRVAGGASVLERARLSAVTFAVSALRAGQLAMANELRVTVSPTAAEWGWFVDQTPEDDEEFEAPSATGERLAKQHGPAFGKMDLLTVLMHELGHVLGRDDLDALTYPGDLMTSTLPVGVRRR